MLCRNRRRRRRRRRIVGVAWIRLKTFWPKQSNERANKWGAGPVEYVQMKCYILCGCQHKNNNNNNVNNRNWGERERELARTTVIPDKNKHEEDGNDNNEP